MTLSYVVIFIFVLQSNIYLRWFNVMSDKVLKGTTSKLIRFPNWLIADFEKCKLKYPSLNFSKVVIFALSKDLQRYK